MTTPLESAIQYYQDLLIYQYLSKPKAYATIGVLANDALCDLLPQAVSAAFDLDTAVGPQLDVLGQYIGFNRNIPIQIPRDYFEMVDYQAPVARTGFTDYTDNTINAGSVFYLYVFANDTFYTLSDSEYRPLLKLKVILNNLDNTMYSISNALYTFFALQIIAFDQEDMSMSYAVSPDASRIALIAASQRLLPKPMGVRISGIFQISNPGNVFSFANYLYNTGNNTGFSDYQTGFNGDYWLSYTDKIL